MSRDPEILVVETSNFIHLYIYVLCIYTQIIWTISRVYYWAVICFLFYSIMFLNPEIYYLFLGFTTHVQGFY